MDVLTEGRRIPEWTVADRLRKARQTAGLTQQELAEEIDVCKRSIAAYEAGKPIRRPALLSWAIRCQVPMVWLQTGEGPSTPPGGITSTDFCAPVRAIRAA